MRLKKENCRPNEFARLQKALVNEVEGAQCEPSFVSIDARKATVSSVTRVTKTGWSSSSSSSTARTTSTTSVSKLLRSRSTTRSSLAHPTLLTPQGQQPRRDLKLREKVY